MEYFFSLFKLQVKILMFGASWLCSEMSPRSSCLRVSGPVWNVRNWVSEFEWSLSTHLLKMVAKLLMFGASCLLKNITTTSHVCGFLALFGLFEIGHQSSGGVLPLSA